MLLLIPQAIPLSIPVALSIAIVATGYRLRDREARIRRVLALAVVATLLAFATLVLLMPEANQSFRVALAGELGGRGISHVSVPRGANELSLGELAARGDEYEAGGAFQRAREFRHAYHLRFALPAATLVLGLLSLGICAITPRRVLGVAALVIALGAYYAALMLTVSSSFLARVPPFASAWIPNLLFLAVSLVLLRTTPRSRPTTSHLA